MVRAGPHRLDHVPAVDRGVEAAGDLDVDLVVVVRVEEGRGDHVRVEQIEAAVHVEAVRAVVRERRGHHLRLVPDPGEVAGRQVQAGGVHPDAVCGVAPVAVSGSARPAAYGPGEAAELEGPGLSRSGEQQEQRRQQDDAPPRSPRACGLQTPRDGSPHRGQAAQGAVSSACRGGAWSMMFHRPPDPARRLLGSCSGEFPATGITIPLAACALRRFSWPYREIEQPVEHLRSWLLPRVEAGRLPRSARAGSPETRAAPALDGFLRLDGPTSQPCVASPCPASPFC